MGKHTNRKNFTARFTPVMVDVFNEIQEANPQFYDVGIVNLLCEHYVKTKNTTQENNTELAELQEKLQDLQTINDNLLAEKQAIEATSSKININNIELYKQVQELKQKLSTADSENLIELSNQDILNLKQQLEQSKDLNQTQFEQIQGLLGKIQDLEDKLEAVGNSDVTAVLEQEKADLLHKNELLLQELHQMRQDLNSNALQLNTMQLAAERSKENTLEIVMNAAMIEIIDVFTLRLQEKWNDTSIVPSTWIVDLLFNYIVKQPVQITNFPFVVKKQEINAILLKHK